MLQFTQNPSKSIYKNPNQKILDTLNDPLPAAKVNSGIDFSGIGIKTAANSDAEQAEKERKIREAFYDTIFPGPSQTDLEYGKAKHSADTAQAAYENYMKSQERAKKAEEVRKQNDQIAFSSGGSIIPGYGIPGIGMPFKDEKEMELKAKADYYKNQQKAIADQRIMETDIAAISAMTQEDRSALELYVVNRYRDLNAPVELTSSPFYLTAEQEASSLIAKYGKQKVDELAESYMRQKGQIASANIRNAAQKGAGSGTMGAIGHSAGSVFANAVGTLIGAPGLLQSAATSTGRYQTMDPNNPGSLPGQYAGAVRQTVAENIEKDNGLLGKVGSTVYQAGMSAADNLVRIAMGGGTTFGTLGLAAVGSFGQSVNQASSQGAAPAQAVLKGVADAFIEVGTEYIPLDNLFKAGKSGAVSAGKAIKEALKQAGIEATTEEISYLGSLAADAAILQDKSGYNQQIGELVANGMSYEDAKKQANAQLWNEAVDTFFTSYLSGGMMSGAQSGANYLAQMQQDNARYKAELSRDIQAMMQRDAARNATQNATAPENATVSGLETVGDKNATTEKPETVTQVSDLPQKEKERAMRDILTQTTEADKSKTKAQQPSMEQKIRESIQEIPTKKETADTGEAAGIKQQIQNSQDKLNEMEPVAGIQTPKEFTQMDLMQKVDWVIEKLRPTNYQVNRKGFGVIKFARKQLRSAFNYFKSGTVEEAAFEAIPYVLEHGTEISSRDDHKNRGYGTVTFAAPVTIDGRRGNMAVVVKKTSDNFYKVHRILCPDGSVFELQDANKAGPTMAGESPENGSLATPKGPASDNIISEADSNVNGLNAPNAAAEDFEAMGAASRGFTGKEAYNELLTDENVQPVRPWAVREMEVPKVDAAGRRVTEFAANAAGAAATSDAVADTLAQLIGEGAMSFESRGKQQSINNAVSELEKRPISEVVGEISERVSEGTIKDGDIEKALVAYNLLSNDGTAEGQARAAAMLSMLGKMANISGRNLNMFGILKKLDPNMQVKAVQNDIDRTIKELNKERSAKKKIGQPEGKKILDASRKAKSDVTGKIRSNAGKIRVDGGKVKTSNQAGQPFIFEYAEKVGQELAKAMIPKVSRERTTMERITSQLRRWAAEKAPAKERVKHLTAVDLLRDYIQNKDFYNQAWENAQMQLAEHAKGRLQGIRDLDDLVFSGVGEELSSIAGIITSGIGVDGTADARNKIFLKAMTEAAVDIGETKRTMANKTALGITDAQIAEKIAGNLIEKTGAEGEMANTIREAVRNYVKKITDEADMDKLLENQIKAAMTDIGETLSKVAKKTAGRRENVQKLISDLLVKKHGLSAENAEEVARTVGEQFGKMVKQRAEEILKSRFAERKGKNERTIMEVFEEYVNLGAFDIGSDFNEASARKLFGDQAVKINEELAEAFKKAKTDDEKAKALDNIYKDIASRIKPTVWEMWDAWRNLAMLGNFKTRERNNLGSAAFRPSVTAKRVIGAALERVFVDQENRTKAIIGTGSESKALLAWAKQDAKSESAQKMMQYSGTTGNEVRSAIEEHRRYLPGKLENLRRGNMKAMENDDMVFKRREYALSLAGFLKARGYTANQAEMGIMAEGGIPTEVMDEARAYAAQEAMKATFNDRNRFSDAVARLRVKGNKPWDRAANIVLKGILPFTRTPANVTVRAVEYSPAGIAKALHTLTSEVKNGNATISEGLDQLASGLTGTGAMVIGAALATGLIPGFRLVGRLSKEEKEEDPDAIEYSIQIGNKYYGISFLAPGAIPLLIGANVYHSFWEKEEIVDGWDVVSSGLATVADIMDPMLELSMLSSLNDLVETVRYEESPGEMLLAAVTNAATNYFTQGLPTLFGQIEQTTEKTKSSVYSNADNPVQRSFERTIGRATQRIPGIDLYQVDRLDAQGNPVENGPWYQRAADALFNPFTHSESGATPVTKERSRLGISAPTVSKTISFTDKKGQKHENYRLSGEEFAELKRILLSNADRITAEMLENADYMKLPDELKEKALKYVDDYARELARVETISDYKGFSESWMENAKGNETAFIIQKVTGADISDAMNAVSKSWREGYDDTKARAALEAAFEQYGSLSEEAQASIGEDASGRMEAYLNARKQGIETDTFVDLYKDFWDIDQKNASQSDKAQQWARTLEKAYESGTITEKQKNQLKNDMVFYQNFPAETEKFDQLTEAGISADDAYDLGWLLNGITGTGAVDKETGKAHVRDVDKWESIADADFLSESEIDTAMKIYMPDYDPEDESPDKTELKYDYARQEWGLSAAEYAAIYRVQADGDNKEEKVAGWKALGYSDKECELLWNLFGSSGKNKIDVVSWYEQQQ